MFCSSTFKTEKNVKKMVSAFIIKSLLNETIRNRTQQGLEEVIGAHASPA